MAQIVEESVKSTVTVMDKVNAATEEVHRNNELAGQLEQGFDNVKDAVNKGNAAVEEAKSTIMSVENTVGAAPQDDRCTADRNETYYRYSRGN